jgi:SAM-dependent methyltransferase
MSHLARLRNEQAFHDRQAQQRAADLARRSLVFADDDYLDHASWIRPAMARLGEVSGKRILDLGCGHGMAAVVLARRGARVTALDLSADYLREAAQRAAANRALVSFVQADAERLPFADGSFDGIWGNAVLHHLDTRRAAQEVRRVLVAGSIAVFCEPWGDNPLVRWARRWLPYREKQRSLDESPLSSEDLAIVRRVFPHMHVEGHQLLSMAGRLLGPRFRIPMLTSCDARLLQCCPALGRWCRYALLLLRKTT